MYDILLQSGRVIDPANKLDAAMDIAIADGAIAAIATSIDSIEANQTRDLSGCLVTPGLIDLHTHVYWAGTSIGVEPTRYAHQAGTTTLIDAGTAGAANFLGFRKHVIEKAQPRILAFLNISFPGIYAFSESVMVGECANLDLLEPSECLEVAREHSDLIVGIKVRVGRGASGSTLLLIYWALSLPTLGTEVAVVCRQYPSLRGVLLRLLEPLSAPDAEAEPREDSTDGIGAREPRLDAEAPHDRGRSQRDAQREKEQHQDAHHLHRGLRRSDAIAVLAEIAPEQFAQTVVVINHHNMRRIHVERRRQMRSLTGLILVHKVSICQRPSDRVKRSWPERR